MSEKRLALVTGTGALVPRAIAAAREQGWVVRVFMFVPRDDLAHEEPFQLRISRPDQALREVRRFGATHVCVVGGTHLSDKDREDLAAIADDTPRREKQEGRGDAALTRLGNKLLAMLGIPFIGVHEIISDLLAPEGRIAGPEPDATLTRTLRFAADTARRAGGFDLGQAAVVSGGRVIAIEDIGGTDLLLRRCAEFRAQGLIGDGAGRLVLGKTSKPGQPRHIDLPAIGPDTISGAVAAGIRGIAVEAGRTLLIEREALVAAADAAGISLVGFVFSDG